MQNAFAALALDDTDSANDVDDAYNEAHIATMPAACPVLDASTGQQLEHRQLRRHPAYKQDWDTSYANELGRLCQGIGHDDATASKQRVEGTDTFHPIHYHDIKALITIQEEQEEANEASFAKEIIQSVVTRRLRPRRSQGG